MFHIALHFIVPAIIVGLFFKSQPRGNNTLAYVLSFALPYALIMATMLVDIDHLLATPIYDPLRCSIGFHPLHQLPAILFYLMLCFAAKTRIIGIGLLIHMALDSLDCYINQGLWYFNS